MSKITHAVSRDTTATMTWQKRCKTFNYDSIDAILRNVISVSGSLNRLSVLKHTKCFFLAFWFFYSLNSSKFPFLKWHLLPG